MSDRKLGEPIRIVRNLSGGSNDGNNYRIFILLQDQDGVDLEPEFEIPHIANGTFEDKTRTMPDVDYVSINGKVMEPNGVTLSKTYGTFIEEVRRDRTGEAVDDNLDSPISGIVNVESDIFAEIESVEEVNLTMQIEE